MQCVYYTEKLVLVTCFAKLQVQLIALEDTSCSAMMDDDECVLSYIEIVPLDNSGNCSDVKQEPDLVKVCVYLRKKAVAQRM